MDESEVIYLNGRAAAEFRIAQQAGSVEQARPHYAMAIGYLDRAEALNRRLRAGAEISGESRPLYSKVVSEG